jgi:hypothetical protein
MVGILTLRKVSQPKEVVFALHQFTQGFVWLGMAGLINPRALQISESLLSSIHRGYYSFSSP